MIPYHSRQHFSYLAVFRLFSMIFPDGAKGSLEVLPPEGGLEKWAGGGDVTPAESGGGFLTSPKNTTKFSSFRLLSVSLVQESER